jgi:hypothetical protein
MPIPLDAISQRKLVLVKQLYQLAFNQSELRHSTINRIVSVIGFDLTVETLLKTVVSALIQISTRQISFPAFLNSAINYLRLTLCL